MPQEGPIVSTGRGGAGNIGHDPTVYTDGGVVREGYLGEFTSGESTGRGGAGNLASPKLVPVGHRSVSQDVIPQTNIRPGEGYENFHTGRGGEGNIHREKYGGHSSPQKEESLVDKAKHLFHLDGKDGHHGKDGKVGK